MQNNKPLFSFYRESGDMIYLAGQVGQVNGKIISPDFFEQFKQAVVNVENILKSVNLNSDNIIDVIIFLTNMGDYHLLNSLYANWFINTQVMPCRTCVSVVSLPLGATVELKVVASRK